MEAAATIWLNAADVPVRRAAPAKKLSDRPLHALSPYERQRLAEALDAEEAADAKWSALQVVAPLTESGPTSAAGTAPEARGHVSVR